MMSDACWLIDRLTPSFESVVELSKISILHNIEVTVITTWNENSLWLQGFQSLIVNESFFVVFLVPLREDLLAIRYDNLLLLLELTTNLRSFSNNVYLFGMSFLKVLRKVRSNLLFV